MKKLLLVLSVGMMLTGLAWLLAGCAAHVPVFSPVAPVRPTHLLRALAPRGTNYALTLSWNYDLSSSPDVTGYRLYQGVASGLYTNVVQVPGSTNLQTVLSNLVKNVQYYYAVTAYNGIESPYCMETNYTFKVAPPLSNVFYTVTMQSATNLTGTWNLFTNMAPIRLTNPVPSVMFLRLSITATNF